MNKYVNRRITPEANAKISKIGINSKPKKHGYEVVEDLLTLVDNKGNVRLSTVCKDK